MITNKIILKFNGSLLLVGALLVGCGPDEVKQTDKKPATVSVVEIKPESIPIDTSYAATAEAIRHTQIRARIDGYLLEQEYKDGALVKKGQTLIQIDSAPYKLAVDNSQAKQQAIEAQYMNAKENFDRVAPLYESKAATKQEYDTAVATLRTLKANLLAANAEVEQAKLNLSYCKITAPFDGVADKILQYEGSYIIPAQNGLLTTLSQINPIRMNFEMSETDYETILSASGAQNLIGQTVKVIFANGKNYESVGKIDYIAPTINQTTGTRTARIIVDNKDGKLSPGQYAHVEFGNINMKNVFLIPQKSLMQGEHGYFVYKAVDKTSVIQQAVTLGKWVGDKVIIMQGIKNGDLVVKNGIEKIGNDGKIIIKN
jgi:membrane fusion protein (multidrug efflux system)